MLGFQDWLRDNYGVEIESDYQGPEPYEEKEKKFIRDMDQWRLQSIMVEYRDYLRSQ